MTAGMQAIGANRAVWKSYWAEALRSAKRAIVSRGTFTTPNRVFRVAYEARNRTSGAVTKDYRFIHELGRHANCVFDVGANVGLTSLLLADAAGPDARIVAFEASEASCLVIRENAVLNQIWNIQIVNAVIGRRSGDAVEFNWDFVSSNSSIFGATASGRSIPLTMTTTSLDDFVRSTGLAPDAVKIDVEGAEIEVVPGMAEVLREHAPLVLVELHSWPGMTIRAVADRIMEVVEPARYRMVDLDSKQTVSSTSLFNKHRSGAHVASQNRVLLLGKDRPLPDWVVAFDTSGL